MTGQTVIFSLFVIFSSAALVATLALFTRQSLLVAYILLGMLLGQWGLKLVGNPQQVQQIGEVGIIFLLFLLGLHLNPQDLWHMFRKVTLVALVSSIVFALMGYVIGICFGFTIIESTIIGLTMMFSSTIIGLKLLPTTILHHQHTGEIMISLLLMQDLIAIIALLIIHGLGTSMSMSVVKIGLIAISLPALILFSFWAERYILSALLMRFDRIQEYIFLLSIGWCLGMSQLARLMGLSEEVGAFIAGVAIASGPIALFIAESLKPLRDFFLVLFFFSIGASFNIAYFPNIIIPALILATLTLIVKPAMFSVLLQKIGESKPVSWEVGLRLGQASEFSLLLAAMAVTTLPSMVSARTNYLVQATTILTFIASSYLVVLRYPTPLAFSEKLRRD